MSALRSEPGAPVAAPPARPEKPKRKPRRAVLGATVAITGVWSSTLLGRTPGVQSWLRPTILVAGLVAALGMPGSGTAQ